MTNSPTINNQQPYNELHARSAFSFLEGSSVPEELVARAAALDFPALAILDRDIVIRCWPKIARATRTSAG
jgi:DNA polymerase III alpha subunit